SGTLANSELGTRNSERSGSFDFLRLLLFQDFVDGLVQDRAVTMDVHALRIRFSFYHIKPPFAIGVFVYNCNPLFQERIGAGEAPFRDAIEVGNGLESF